MTHLTGRNVNTNDEASVPAGFVLDAVTSVKIADANPNRVFFRVDNNFNNVGVWVKLQAASVDDDMKGIALQPLNIRGRTSWEMSPDNIYTGEICAIADSGTPTVFVTEY